jgi:citrate lyase subunit beta/citryl-CoA lyase
MTDDTVGLKEHPARLKATLGRAELEGAAYKVVMFVRGLLRLLTTLLQLRFLFMTGNRLAASYLFVPATSPERISKALASGADRVIVDLEDGVATKDKDRARKGLFDLIVTQPIILRINARGSEFFEADLEAAVALAWVNAIMIPKVECGEDVTSVASSLPEDVEVLALVESALGIVNAEKIAKTRPSRMVFGSADYLADINVKPSTEALAYPRSRLVVASRAHDLPAPVDGPSLAIEDLSALLLDAVSARALGLGAKLCIHPTQVASVNKIFRSSEVEREWALAVLEEATHHGGVFQFNGEMVDEPVLRRARRILSGP